MKRIFRRLTLLLMMTGIIASLVALVAPGPVQAATCTPKATLPADIPPSGTFDTGVHVIATFGNARQQEGCDVPLSIDPTAYDAATPQIQELLLVNAERRDRGLSTLQLDTTLLSQIDFNHSAEMVQYNYFAHSSPINQPGGNSGSFARLTVNPAINGHWDGLGENIAGGGPAGDAIYRFMYVDSASKWGTAKTFLATVEAGLVTRPGLASASRPVASTASTPPSISSMMPIARSMRPHRLPTHSRQR